MTATNALTTDDAGYFISDTAIYDARGVVHGFTNRSTGPATCLCILSPGVLGPQYFKEMAALLSAGAPPDPAKMKETMLRYGLVPAPTA